MNTTKTMVQKALSARVSRRVAKREERRRGQALLLAVLLMVFAALLGSTFITVVALNLSQSSRGESKQDAQNSALAGLRDANTQLQVSEQGERWRPEQVNTPPFCGDGSLPADVDCDAYYTPFEKAQGWARDVPTAKSSDNDSAAGVTGGDWDGNSDFEQQKDDWAKLEYFKKTFGKRVFVKFPDPRQLSGSNAQRPTYLVEVKPVTQGEKKDELQIDVIGRSSNSETAFYRTTTNKGTSASGAPVAFARYDANFNTEIGKPLETELLVNNTGDTSIVIDPAAPYVTVKDARGITPGMTLLLQQGTIFRDAVVKEVKDGTRPNTSRVFLRVLRTVTPAETAYGTGYTVGSKVRVVSTLMDGVTSLDDDGDIATTTVSTLPPLRSATDPATTGTKRVVGAHINNGLVVKGTAALALSPTAPDSAVPNSKDYLDVQGRVITSSGAQLRDASSPSTLVAMPSSSGDPGTGANKIGSTSLSSLQLLVRDSVQADAGDPTQRGNSVRSISPPSLDKSSKRYLKLTKLADVENGSAYGYGPGVFIDNREDVEKVGVVVPTTPATDPSYRPLSVSDLQRFWQRKTFVAKETAGATPTAPDQAPGTTAYKDDIVSPVVAPGTTLRGQVDPIHYRHDLSFSTSGGGSLEQRHIRGWISATEFLPRGVLVELDADNNRIIITRDDASDASGSAPDESKAWKDVQGQSKASVTTSPMSPRNYRMVLDLTTDPIKGRTNGQRSFGAPGFEVPVGSATPFNGLIYAEGNVRVRGTVGNLNKDITIVSMGNIYVEGSIKRANANSDHVALLAKKNVVLNPTQFMPRLAGLKTNDQQAAANAARVYGAATTTATTTEVPVSVAQAFRVGDRLRIGTNAAWTTVTAISATTPDVPNPDTAVGGTANVATLTLSPALAPPPVLSDPIKTLGEPKADGKYYEFGGSANGSDSMFTRNAPLDATVEPHYLWLLHAGGRTGTYFNLTKNDNKGPETRELLLKPDNNLPNAAAKDGKIVAAEKRMYLDPDNSSNSFNIDLKDATNYPTIGSTMFRNTVEQPDSGGAKSWTMADPGGAATLPATVSGAAPWRLASVLRAIYTAPGQSHPLPLTTSAVTFWSSGLDNLSFSPFSSIIGTHPTDATYDEKIDTASELFYQRKSTAGTYDQAPLHWTEFTLPDAGGNYTGAVSSSVAPNTLATYRFAGFRLNRERYNAATPTFKTAMDVEVDASIFAQDGSWFVIPMPFLGALDADGDSSVSPDEYANSLSASEIMNIVDANDNGSVTEAEYTAGANAMKLFAQAKAARFRRPGYKITIKGNIAQNVSPTTDVDYDDETDPDGNAFGAVKTWIDSLSCPTTVVTSGAGSYKGAEYQSIEYQAAPLPSDNKLYLPVSPDLVYQG